MKAHIIECEDGTLDIIADGEKPTCKIIYAKTVFDICDHVFFILKEDHPYRIKEEQLNLLLK